jgi:hypothetical protein
MVSFIKQYPLYLISLFVVLILFILAAFMFRYTPLHRSDGFMVWDNFSHRMCVAQLFYKPTCSADEIHKLSEQIQQEDDERAKKQQASEDSQFKSIGCTDALLDKCKELLRAGFSLKEIQEWVEQKKNK